MGRKKIEKIMRIDNQKERRTTIGKRKKGLIKKCIELSVLSGMRIFLLLEEEDIKRVTHYASHKDMDPLKVFNDLN